ncbi:MAG: HlyD family efflux transporter periplasmic adaptor subunit [Planctomycetia bacterium]|nr:HlyD family efflux transporter periplasmic adaptor subunit [Planctomycetia bacterium]
MSDAIEPLNDADGVARDGRPGPARGTDLLARTATPRAVHVLSRLVLLLFLASPFLLAFVPWQQTVQGRGTVVAYSPVERIQVLTARVSGQVKKWHVVEGSRVKMNDPVVDIEDNDPELAARLEAQREFLVGRLAAAREEVAEQTAAATAQEAAREAAVKAAEANREAARKAIEVAEQAEANAAFAQAFEQNRSKMFEDLFANPQFGGLESRLSRDEAKMRADRAVTDTDKAAAEIRRARAALLTQEAMLLQADATGLSSIAVARSNLRKSEQNLFAIEREIQEIDNRIERFKARLVVAPCDGTVFRVEANVGSGGQYVKEGDELCTIVPDTSDRVVELTLDGFNAPLVLAYADRAGRMPHVRLQFEGWPAVQFSGWPELAIGTFGGRVRQIDSASPGSGRFRVLVEPEGKLPGDQWPDQQFLRQGNQAIGWVFLNRVSLGYEIWRRLNGFPPVLAPAAKEKDGPKPPKIKVG